MFKLHSEYKPTGDQPQAIEKLVDGINRGEWINNNREKLAELNI